MTTEDHRRLALQVLMPGFSGVQVPEWLQSYLADGLGAVCLFAMNTPDVVTTRRLTDQLRAQQPDILITVDEEGGDVTRLQRQQGSWLAGNAALGEIDDARVSLQLGHALGHLVRSAGINLTLAPCVDVNSNPHNPVIGTRSFGADPDQVGRHGLLVARGLRQAGVGGCLKHFPGHGDTATDSHHGLPVINVAAEVLLERDIAPFVQGLPEATAVMTGHIVCTAFGDQPASLSPWAYRLLRDFGFEGPILTDALGMKAVSGDGIGEAVVRALHAGADLCCLDSPHGRDEEATLVEALNAVVAALQSGRLDPELLLASHRRIAACVRHTTPAEGWDGGRVDIESTVRQLGLETARRAQRRFGETRLGGGDGSFCDLRFRSNLASGAAGTVMVDELNRARRQLGQPVLETVDLEQALSRTGELVVLTRLAASDADEGARLAAVLSARPDAVVIHAGVLGSRPDAERVLCTLGLGRANAVAAAETLTDDEDGA